MDFIGGALPNVMFLIGVIAIGIGLGLEFKIIEVKNGLSRGGRIGACVVGVVLVATSIALYLRPPQIASRPAPAMAAAAEVPSTPTPAQGVASAPTSAATDMPTAAATAVPTPAPTEVATVVMPDIRGLSPKDATKQLAELGLILGEPQESCAALGVRDDLVAEVKKNRIACQSVEPGSNVALQGSVAYALSED